MGIFNGYKLLHGCHHRVEVGISSREKPLTSYERSTLWGKQIRSADDKEVLEAKEEDEERASD